MNIWFAYSAHPELAADPTIDWGRPLCHYMLTLSLIPMAYQSKILLAMATDSNEGLPGIHSSP